MNDQRILELLMMSQALDRERANGAYFGGLTNEEILRGIVGRMGGDNDDSNDYDDDDDDGDDRYYRSYNPRYEDKRDTKYVPDQLLSTNPKVYVPYLVQEVFPLFTFHRKALVFRVKSLLQDNLDKFFKTDPNWFYPLLFTSQGCQLLSQLEQESRGFLHSIFCSWSTDTRSAGKSKSAGKAPATAHPAPPEGAAVLDTLVNDPIMSLLLQIQSKPTRAHSETVLLGQLLDSPIALSKVCKIMAFYIHPTNSAHLARVRARNPYYQIATVSKQFNNSESGLLDWADGNWTPNHHPNNNNAPSSTPAYPSTSTFSATTAPIIPAKTQTKTPTNGLPVVTRADRIRRLVRQLDTRRTDQVETFSRRQRCGGAGCANFHSDTEQDDETEQVLPGDIKEEILPPDHTALPIHGDPYTVRKLKFDPHLDLLANEIVSLDAFHFHNRLFPQIASRNVPTTTLQHLFPTMDVTQFAPEFDWFLYALSLYRATSFTQATKPFMKFSNSVFPLKNHETKTAILKEAPAVLALPQCRENKLVNSFEEFLQASLTAGTPDAKTGDKVQQHQQQPEYDEQAQHPQASSPTVLSTSALIPITLPNHLVLPTFTIEHPFITDSPEEQARLEKQQKVQGAKKPVKKDSTTSTTPASTPTSFLGKTATTENNLAFMTYFLTMFLMGNPLAHIKADQAYTQHVLTGLQHNPAEAAPFKTLEKILRSLEPLRLYENNLVDYYSGGVYDEGLQHRLLKTAALPSLVEPPSWMGAQSTIVAAGSKPHQPTPPIPMPCLPFRPSTFYGSTQPSPPELQVHNRLKHALRVPKRYARLTGRNAHLQQTISDCRGLQYSPTLELQFNIFRLRMFMLATTPFDQLRSIHIPLINDPPHLQQQPQPPHQGLWTPPNQQNPPPAPAPRLPITILPFHNDEARANSALVQRNPFLWHQFFHSAHRGSKLDESKLTPCHALSDLLASKDMELPFFDLFVEYAYVYTPELLDQCLFQQVALPTLRLSADSIWTEAGAEQHIAECLVTFFVLRSYDLYKAGRPTLHQALYLQSIIDPTPLSPTSTAMMFIKAPFVTLPRASRVLQKHILLLAHASFLSPVAPTTDLATRLEIEQMLLGSELNALALPHDCKLFSPSTTPPTSKAQTNNKNNTTTTSTNQESNDPLSASPLLQELVNSNYSPETKEKLRRQYQTTKTTTLSANHFSRLLAEDYYAYFVKMTDLGYTGCRTPPNAYYSRAHILSQLTPEALLKFHTALLPLRALAYSYMTNQSGLNMIFPTPAPRMFRLAFGVKSYGESPTTLPMPQLFQNMMRLHGAPLYGEFNFNSMIDLKLRQHPLLCTFDDEGELTKICEVHHTLTQVLATPDGDFVEAYEVDSKGKLPEGMFQTLLELETIPHHVPTIKDSHQFCWGEVMQKHLGLKHEPKTPYDSHYVGSLDELQHHPYAPFPLKVHVLAPTEDSVPADRNVMLKCQRIHKQYLRELYQDQLSLFQTEFHRVLANSHQNGLYNIYDVDGTANGSQSSSYPFPPLVLVKTEKNYASSPVFIKLLARWNLEMLITCLLGLQPFQAPHAPSVPNTSRQQSTNTSNLPAIPGFLDYYHYPSTTFELNRHAHNAPVDPTALAAALNFFLSSHRATFLPNTAKLTTINVPRPTPDSTSSNVCAPPASLSKWSTLADLMQMHVSRPITVMAEQIFSLLDDETTSAASTTSTASQ